MKLDEHEILQTCLSKSSIMFQDEEVKDAANLKRKRDTLDDHECRIPMKKRVSFGGVKVLNDSYVEASNSQTNDKSPHSFSEYQDLALKVERLEREIEILEVNSAEKHRDQLTASNLNYNSLLESLNKKLGINPRAPTDDDIMSMKTQNEEKSRTLKNLQANLLHETERHRTLLDKASEELTRIEEELRESKITKDARSQDSKCKLDKLRGQLRMYTGLTRMELTRTTDSLYRCRAIKSESEHMTFDIRFDVNERTHENVIHYSKVASTLNELECFLNASNFSLIESEIPMIFRRLMNVVTGCNSMH